MNLIPNVMQANIWPTHTWDIIHAVTWTNGLVSWSQLTWASPHCTPTPFIGIGFIWLCGWLDAWWSVSDAREIFAVKTAPLARSLSMYWTVAAYYCADFVYRWLHWLVDLHFEKLIYLFRVLLVCFLISTSAVLKALKNYLCHSTHSHHLDIGIISEIFHLKGIPCYKVCWSHEKYKACYDTLFWFTILECLFYGSLYWSSASLAADVKLYAG